MNTKPFKDIEQVIKDAAEGYEPPFEDASWNKMEALLDKEKERRKPLFWLWWLLPLFIIGGSVGGYLLFKDDAKSDSKDITVTEKKGSPVDDPGGSVLPATENSPGKIPVQPVAPGGSANSTSYPSKDLPIDRKNSPVAKLAIVPGSGGNEEFQGKTSKIIDKAQGKSKVRIGAPGATGDLENPLVVKTEPVEDKAQPPGNVNDKPADEGRAKITEEPTTVKKEEQLPGKTPLQKGNRSSQSRFYLIATAGVEGSSVDIFSIDKIAAKGGVTIGYQLGKKISLQTGFFAGSKKYIAGPGDYHPKGGYWSTVDIIKVDANCLVYEVPLNIRYDFAEGKALKIFATTGLSSYIMKKEGYHYSYNRSGYPHYGKADYTGNEHLFSVLKLSAGVEKNISKTLSLHASPALSIPLAGVGDGRVKLYSSELLVGLRYQPLKK